MSMFQTPPSRGVKTRAQLKKETSANEEVGELLEVKSDVLHNRNTVKISVLGDNKVHSDIVPAYATQKDGGAHERTSTRASSSAARQLRLEYETAQAKAQIELKEAEAQADLITKKAQIEKKLLEKKLAAELADLEGHSQRSSSASYRSRIENWLEKSVAAQGSSLRDMEPRQSAAPVESSTCRAIAELSDAIKDAVGAAASHSNNNNVLSRLATSKDLPTYYGDPMEWLHLKEAYYESTRLCNYSDQENLWRLRKCLRGEAKEATSSLLMSASSPQEIMETLELRFGRPENIMRKVTSQLRKLQPLPQAYNTEIVNLAIKVKNYVTTTRNIQQEDYLRSPELLTIIINKLPTALISMWANYLHEKGDSGIPKLELLSEFLYAEAKKVANSGLSYIYASDSKRKPEHNTQRSHHSILSCTEVTSTVLKCTFCRKSHRLTDCTRFKRALRKDRWSHARAMKLCFKCLRPRHADPSTCNAECCDIEGCGGPHHRLLHWAKPQAAPQESPSHDQQHDVVAHAVSSVPECPQVLALSVDKSINSVPQMPIVLLKLVPVTVHGPKQSVKTYALLDDGATVSLISADIADRAGLHGKNYTMRATSAWDSAELVCTTELINLDLSNSVGDRFKLRARKMKELNLPLQFVSKIDHSLNSKLSSLYCYNLNETIIKPMLLIGQDNYDLIAPITCKRYMPGGPFITQTLLGWCVHGTLYNNKNIQKYPTAQLHNIVAGCADSVAMTHPQPHQAATRAAFCTLSTLPTDIDNDTCNSDAELHDLVRRSFLLDSIDICSKPRENIDEVRAVDIINKSAKLINNRWTVGLPWKDESPMPNSSYSLALKRLNSIERKMSLNTEYELRYRERVEHLFINNYARKLSVTEYSDPGITRRWYLPHFGVDNPNKKKLRLVFDAAAKCNNVSLNDFLLRGPDLLNSLYGIMFRFRENPIGIIGDIKDMFLKIKIHNEDQHALRFLWKEKGSDVIDHYAMTSLIFGANCSPFIAQAINQNKNASRFIDEMPEAVRAIQTNQYMDDYIDSFSNELFASKIIKEITYIHKQGDFEMRNWLSNVPLVLSDLPKETLNDKVIRFDIDKQPERALGLLWYPNTDMLAFDLSFKSVPTDIILLKQVPTKREVLRIVMSIFDIHGYLAPFTIKGKILMRNIWKSNLQWDSKLDDDLFNVFKRWLSQAHEINSIRIPRWYFSCHTRSNENESLALHLFCDASPSGIAAVAYWRKESNDGRVSVSFVASKCKVAPIKPVSVPRLELQGAVLACRLAQSIQKEHRLQPHFINYWTDSTTVLYWIGNHSRSYKVFIANRLGEIDEHSTRNQWHYVPTDLNIADIGTKHVDYVLSSDSEWFTGPSFLYQPRTRWPQQPEKIKINNDEILEKINLVHKNNEICNLPVPDPTRFSSWLKLLRTTATVLLFIEKCKKSSLSCINDELIHKAELLLLRHSQTQSFQCEINCLNVNAKLNRDSRLGTLTPIIDENKLLRVGSRIGNVKGVDQMTKYPVILDGKNYIARLIVMHYHVSAAHSCNEMVINELRQKYWLIKLRPTVRSVAKQCLVCRFRKALPSPPRLGDLPECRLTHHQRPFTMCGIDLFGPIEVAVGRQRTRRYGVLFTCLTVRAVHIELVSSLTTDSMIMALRRMAARRGWPHTVFSDNGTNLRGADTELRRAYEEVLSNQAHLVADALNKGVRWQFIPPGSPHMGGAWERLIRSVKTVLKVVLKERAPREETLATFLCEVENMINSRPLTHVSVDPRDPEALTPNHFLLGSSSNLPQAGVYDDSDLYLRKQWRIAQRLADLFWSRWIKEVLPTLAPRPKWSGEGAQLKVGDLVVVVDPSSPRNVWPKGVVDRVYPGSDGRIRVLDIRTKSGIMKRPASRVALLLGYECRNHDTGGQDVDNASQ